MIGKAIMCAGAALFLAALALILILTANFASHPTVADLSKGWVVPFDLHGTYHYVSQGAKSAFDWASIVAGLAFGITAVGAYYSPKNSK